MWTSAEAPLRVTDTPLLGDAVLFMPEATPASEAPQASMETFVPAMAIRLPQPPIGVPAPVWSLDLAVLALTLLSVLLFTVNEPSFAAIDALAAFVLQTIVVVQRLRRR